MEVGNGRVRQSEEEMEVVMEEAPRQAGRKEGCFQNSEQEMENLSNASRNGRGRCKQP